MKILLSDAISIGKSLIRVQQTSAGAMFALVSEKLFSVDLNGLKSFIDKATDTHANRFAHTQKRKRIQLFCT